MLLITWAITHSFLVEKLFFYTKTKQKVVISILNEMEIVVLSDWFDNIVAEFDKTVPLRIS